MGILALRIINLIVALLTLPPLFYLVHKLYVEEKLIPVQRIFLNRVVRYSLLLFAFSGILNATILFLILIESRYSKTLGFSYFINAKNLLINISFLIVGWGIYFFIEKRK